MGMSRFRERILRAGDGTNLHLRDMGDVDADRALLVIHGYGEHGGRYIRTLEPFVEAGYRVLLPDLRGHGRSEGRRGHVMRFQQYLDDVRLFLDELQTPADQTALLGHSNGGLIVLQWLLRNHSSVGAAAVTSPFLGVALDAPAWKIWAGKILSRVTPTLNLPSEIEARDVSRDPAVVESYDSDPLIHHVINARWYTEAMAAIDEAFVKSNNIRTPLLVVQAGDDRIADAQATRRWVGGVSADFVEHEEAEGAFHEVLFDLDGDRYRDRILRFFNEKLS